jgi:hypothetical protein
MGVWHQLLVDPETCLPAAACLQGLLLRTVSSLVDAAIPAAAQASEAHLAAISLALLRLLQFSDVLERCGGDLQPPCPLAWQSRTRAGTRQPRRVTALWPSRQAAQVLGQAR